MKEILAVNLEEALTASLGEALHRRGLGVRVQSVPPQRATDAVRQTSFDLVVVDLAEQPAPPPNLLPALTESSPGTRVVVLTGGAVSPGADRPRELDGVELLERALPVEELCARIAAVLQRGVKGHIENVGLAAFTQLLSIEKESCTVAVSAAGGSGSLVFVRGELWDARRGAKQGDEAVIEIFGWDTANVDVSGVGKKVERTITASLTYLLIEAMRRRDEQLRDAPPAGVPAAGSKVDSRSGAPAAGGAAHLLLGGIAQIVDGFVAACLVDLRSGQMIATRNTRSYLDLQLASAFSRETLWQVLDQVGALHSSSALEDLTFTFDDEIHLLKLSAHGVFLYLVVDRGRTTYPQMRSAVQQLWPAFEAAVATTELGRQAQGISSTLAHGRSDP